MLDEYSEILVEYDNSNLVVYVSGLDGDDFWIEFTCHTDVDNPESFAHGLVEGFKALGMFASAASVDFN